MSTKKFITLDDVDNNLGNDGNMPGIIPTLIYGYQEDVATWPDEPDGTVTELTLDAAGKLTGDVIMKPGTRAYSLDFTEDVGTFKMNTVGEVDSIHWKYELDFIKAKIQAKILGFANAAASRKMFFIPTDENGVQYLMGNKRRGASMANGDGVTTGSGSGDRNQISLKFEFRTRKALAYEGDVEDILILVPVTP